MGQSINFCVPAGPTRIDSVSPKEPSRRMGPLDLGLGRKCRLETHLVRRFEHTVPSRADWIARLLARKVRVRDCGRPKQAAVCPWALIMGRRRAKMHGTPHAPAIWVRKLCVHFQSGRRPGTPQRGRGPGNHRPDVGPRRPAQPSSRRLCSPPRQNRSCRARSRPCVHNRLPEYARCGQRVERRGGEGGGKHSEYLADGGVRAQRQNGQSCAR